MRFKTEISFKTAAVFALVSAVLIAIAVMSIMVFGTVGKIVMPVAAAAVLAVLIAAMCNTCYEFSDEFLIIKSGFFTEYVRYDQVVSITRRGGISLMFALGNNKLEIVYDAVKNYKISVSPTDEKGFLDEYDKKKAAAVGTSGE